MHKQKDANERMVGKEGEREGGVKKREGRVENGTAGKMPGHKALSLSQSVCKH